MIHLGGPDVKRRFSTECSNRKKPTAENQMLNAKGLIGFIPQAGQASVGFLRSLNNTDRRKNMKAGILLLGFASILTSASALIPPGAADEKTGEGWQAVGFPIDDYVPWNLWLQAKEIVAQDRKYLVVEGYLVVSEESAILFPDEEASRSGRLEGALILSRDDSPAMRWLFGRERAEGLYAVGGVLSVTPKGSQLGYFSKIRFAMKKEPIQSAQTTPVSAPR